MLKKVLAGLGALAVTATLAFATGLFPGLPQLGGPSYCASWNIQSSSWLCASTVPAGTTAFLGSEAVPADIYGPSTQTTANAGTSAGNGASPQSEFVSVLQLGQGLFVNDATTTTTLTIGALTEWEYISGTKTNPTYTFTAAPLQGQILHIILGANLTTGITTAAGSGSTCVPACGAISGTTAGTGYAWVYSGTVWYRFQ